MIKNAPIISIVCMPFSCGRVPAGFRRSERFRFTGQPLHVCGAGSPSALKMLTIEANWGAARKV